MTHFQQLLREVDKLSPGEQRALARHIEIGNFVNRALTEKANLPLQQQLQKVKEGLSKGNPSRN